MAHQHVVSLIFCRFLVVKPCSCWEHCTQQEPAGQWPGTGVPPGGFKQPKWVDHSPPSILHTCSHDVDRDNFTFYLVPEYRVMKRRQQTGHTETPRCVRFVYQQRALRPRQTGVFVRTWWRKKSQRSWPGIETETSRRQSVNWLGNPNLQNEGCWIF